MTNESKSILELSGGVVNISAAVVVRKGDKVLLIQENEKERTGVWGFPAGKANFDELIFQAAEREFLEETGYSVRITGLVSVYYYATRKSRFGDRITVRFNFMGELKDELVKSISAREVLKTAWLDDEEISTLIQTRQLRNWINVKLAKEVLARQTFPLDVIFAK